MRLVVGRCRVQRLVHHARGDEGTQLLIAQAASRSWQGAGVELAGDDVQQVGGGFTQRIALGIRAPGTGMQLVRALVAKVCKVAWIQVVGGVRHVHARIEAMHAPIG